MTDQTPDPRIDRMMAALYGELPEAEERAFRRLLEKDPALRAEFEELQGTRGMLAGWEVKERAPSFVMVDSPSREREGETGRGARRAATGMGWLDRILASVRSFGARPAWGLATAAVAVLILAMTGFRVERLDGGLAFRFGDPQPQVASTSTALDRLGSGRSIDGFSASGTQFPRDAREGQLIPVSAVDMVTRGEYDERNSELLMSLASLLNDYGERRDDEVEDVLRNYFLETRSRQDQDYRELNRRIDTLGFQIMREAGYDPGRQDDLLRGRSTAPSVPLELTPNRTKE